MGSQRSSGVTSGDGASLTERILSVLKGIPEGTVLSYGRVAAMAGNPRGARQVARILHSLSEKESLPWHRVINSQNRISLPMDAGGALQRRLLRKEGVTVDKQGRVGVKPARTARKYRRPPKGSQKL